MDVDNSQVYIDLVPSLQLTDTHIVPLSLFYILFFCDQRLNEPKSAPLIQRNGTSQRTYPEMMLEQRFGLLCALF